MNQLCLYSVRAYLRIGLFFYFKKIEVRNASRIPKNTPVLFLANHQNALLDALLIATKNGGFSYFLTRASVFNNALVGKILESLHLLPVYRIRDGWGNLFKNNSVFSKCSKLLNKKQTIVIFPEGNHNLKRTVRPLSKGFTRIIFETLENYPDAQISLIPVGLNFENATNYGDKALINFGDAIKVDSSIVTDKNKNVVKLKNTVFNKLCELTIHIESENYDKTLKQLEDLDADFTKPNDINKCIASGFKTCKSNKPKSDNILKVLSKFLLIINVFVPYLIWKKVVQPKINEIEFTSTFRFAIAITLVPLFIVLVMLILTVTFQLKFGLIYVFNVLVLSLLSVKL